MARQTTSDRESTDKTSRLQVFKTTPTDMTAKTKAAMTGKSHVRHRSLLRINPPTEKP
jgi:hypothetical protein